LLGVSRTTVTRIVDRADSAGLVDRHFPEALDGRVTWCRLTPAGEAMRRRLLIIVRRRARSYFGGRSGVLAAPLEAIRAAWRPTPIGQGRRWYTRPRRLRSELAHQPAEGL
jgi:DNA-binding MarR family transcriptional regulator